jgi:hypothetical protein
VDGGEMSGPILIGSGNGLLTRLNTIIDSPYMQLASAFGELSMPKGSNKERRPFTAISCCECGSQGTLKKIDKDEYKCLACIKKEGSFDV